MLKELKILSAEERRLLLKAPVYVSVLVSCNYNEVNELQKADAIKLAHLKTFTATPLLIPYYIEVDNNFKEQFENTVEKYFPFDEPARSRLKEKVGEINRVLEKLDKTYADELYKSLKQYSEHVRKAAHSVFQDFIFPMPIPGLSD
jgi:hypothetical protein